jgi:hypothetical protein
MGAETGSFDGTELSSFVPDRMEEQVGAVKVATIDVR